MLEEWVEDAARLTRPESVVWCDGSDEENKMLIREMLKNGTLIALNQERYPSCYLHRSNPNDVARTEHLTYICTSRREDAGPTNNYMSPQEAKAKVGKLFENCMKGRVMYAVPYLMGPVGSRYSKVGVQATDSPYVVVSMRIMTRMGKVALDQLGQGAGFVRGLHSLGDLSPDRRFICHFPEENLIWSIGSGYGGNALLNKKCFALRIAGWQARKEGWMAEHMVILGLEDPDGETTYMTAAFPSACGKTNLAMLMPPPSHEGFKVWTIGEDIAWMHFGDDGRLYAINAEAGFFGVAPGTSWKTNPNAMKTISRNTIFANVAVTSDLMPWWEGMEDGVPAEDWQGRPWNPGKGTAAHPNSRFTAPSRQCPSISPRWEDPEGVPISAIIFGGRRSKLAPLVYESFNWEHGVYVGASMASETTAAATVAVGMTRRDPMAMLPFCGYNMADYFAHWLRNGRVNAKLPRIFNVNWFRKNSDSEFLWPGFGENIRVLKWIADRVRGRVKGVESPIGILPSPDDLDLNGLSLSPTTINELLSVDRSAWLEEAKEIRKFFEQFGERLPSELWRQQSLLEERLKGAG